MEAKKAAERTKAELNKVTEHFVKSIGEDRVARREEHTELLTFNKTRHVDSPVDQAEATRSARQTGIDVSTALSFIADSVRYLADSVHIPSRDT